MDIRSVTLRILLNFKVYRTSGSLYAYSSKKYSFYENSGSDVLQLCQNINIILNKGTTVLTLLFAVLNFYIHAGVYPVNSPYRKVHFLSLELFGRSYLHPCW